MHLRSTGFKQLDGGGDTGFEQQRMDVEGALPAVHRSGGPTGDPPEARVLRRRLTRVLPGPDRRGLPRRPLRRYRASQLDRMQWHRTQVVASYQARLRQAFTIDAAIYRQDFSRTWRKVNRLGGAAVASVLANPTTARNAVLYNVLTGANDTASPDEVIFVGPNRRIFVSQGAQLVAGWHGDTGPLSHRVEAGVRYHYDRVDRLHTENAFLMRDGILVPDGPPNATTTFTTADARAWAHALAFHVTGASTWGPITLTPGARVELISTRLRNRMVGTEVAGSPQRVFIPGIGAYAALAPWIGLLAGVHRGFSPPAPGATGTVRPESSIDYEAGVRMMSRRLRLEAIGFFNDYSNLISICTFASGCDDNQVDMQSNAGQTHIYGAELFARAEATLAPGILLPVGAAYTYTRTKFRETFSSENPTWGMVQAGYEIPFVPRHQAQATAAIETPRGSLALAATYVSAMRERAGRRQSARGTAHRSVTHLRRHRAGAVGRRRSCVPERT